MEIGGTQAHGPAVEQVCETMDHTDLSCCCGGWVLLSMFFFGLYVVLFV